MLSYSVCATKFTFRDSSWCIFYNRTPWHCAWRRKAMVTKICAVFLCSCKHVLHYKKLSYVLIKATACCFYGILCTISFWVLPISVRAAKSNGVHHNSRKNTASWLTISINKSEIKCFPPLKKHLLDQNWPSSSLSVWLLSHFVVTLSPYFFTVSFRCLFVSSLPHFIISFSHHWLGSL